MNKKDVDRFYEDLDLFFESERLKFKKWEGSPQEENERVVFKSYKF